MTSPTPTAGVLTTLPVLCFAVIGFGSGGLVRRLGLHRPRSPCWCWSRWATSFAPASPPGPSSPPSRSCRGCCCPATTYTPDPARASACRCGNWSGVLTGVGIPLTPAATTALSLLTQGLGYLLAGLGPFGVGALHDATGSWTAPLLALIASTGVIATAGVVVSRPRMLEDTLPAR